jgi:phenylacetate-CoA ligase
MEQVAFPSIALFTDSRFTRLYREGSAGPRTDIIGRQHDVLPQLNELLQHAYENVPFYRRRIGECGIRPHSLRSVADLSQLPPTTKKDISTHFPDGITDTSQKFKPWRYRSTSGTIERLTVIHDYRKRDVVRAAEMLALNLATKYRPGMRYLEIPPDVCRNVCGAGGAIDPPIARFIIDNLKSRRLLEPTVLSDLRGLAERQLLYRRLTLTSDAQHGAVQSPESLQRYLEATRAYRPHLVKALPIYLYMMAAHISERGLAAPHIPGGLMPMGSSITPLMKREVEKAFQAPVHEDYGSAELGGIGAECGMRNGIHPFSRLFYVEVVCDGRPARPGETGKVLVTDLHSFAMPFIRYEIGDVALVLNPKCECGVPGLRIDVQGRFQDCIRSAAGELITSDRIVDTILSCRNVRIFRLEYHDGRHVRLDIVAKPGIAPDTVEIQDALLRILGAPLSIAVRLVPTVMPEPGGKYRFVKNCVSTEGRPQ